MMHILAIAQGTTSSRAIAFNGAMEVICLDALRHEVFDKRDQWDVFGGTDFVQDV